jgi:hypothetical protein
VTLPSSAYTTVLQSSAITAPPLWNANNSIGYNNVTGFIQGDLGRPHGTNYSCTGTSGSMFIINNAGASGVPVSCQLITSLGALTANVDFEARVKFRFTNNNDQCVGMVIRYSSPSSFFVVSLCRSTQSPAQPPCVTLRQAIRYP